MSVSGSLRSIERADRKYRGILTAEPQTRRLASDRRVHGASFFVRSLLPARDVRDYGEGNSDAQSLGNLTTFIVSGSKSVEPVGARQPRREAREDHPVRARHRAELLRTGRVRRDSFYKDIRNNISVQTIDNLEGIRYTTNGNSSYSDVTGVENLPAEASRPVNPGVCSGVCELHNPVRDRRPGGDPVLITPTGVRYAGSGDAIVYNNPRLKAGVYYQTPPTCRTSGTCSRS